jgi:capsular exopolysaccharide synthesis family protein
MFRKKKDLAENLLIDFPTTSRYAESFRTLRTNLHFTVMEKDLNSVLITSSVAAEGKTTTAINLGHTIAQTGARVLLIDADLRRPSLTAIFGLKKNRGLSDLVARTLGERFATGSLSEASIGDLIQLTRLQNRTVELHVSDSLDEVAFSFVKGKLTDIYWKNRPESKKLANTLIQSKLLTQTEADLALGHQRKSVLRLGTILLSMGLVSEKDLTKTLSVHTIESIIAASKMLQGTFEFRELSEEEIRNPATHNVNLEKLLDEFLGQAGDFIHISRAVTEAIYPTKTDNLFVLPSGKVPPNPSELAGSGRTAFLLAFLKKKYDFIIIDSPPVMPATDALLIAPRTDGTILVVHSGRTEKKIVKDVIVRFETAKLPILGVLLNRVDINREGYYKYYKKYYSSYYGK